MGGSDRLEADTLGSYPARRRATRLSYAIWAVLAPEGAPLQVSSCGSSLAQVRVRVRVRARGRGRLGLVVEVRVRVRDRVRVSPGIGLGLGLG